MIDTLIGGAIAAVIGAVGYAITDFWVERRREKAQQLTIVNALIVETEENLIICKDHTTREMRWLSSYKLEAYGTYKGQLFFLPIVVPTHLIVAANEMEETNTSIQLYLARKASGQPVVEKAVPDPEYLIEHLEIVSKGLRTWKAEHTRSLVFRIRCRLRNFVSKIRKNSGFDYVKKAIYLA